VSEGLEDGEVTASPSSLYDDELPEHGHGEQRGEDGRNTVDAGVVGDAVGALAVTTQVDCWMVWQKLVMDRWKLAMFAARPGPGVKLSRTNWKPRGAPGGTA